MNPLFHIDEDSFGDDIPLTKIIQPQPSTDTKASTIYNQTISLIKLEHGQMHEAEKKHLEKRSKGYELLRLIEDCTKYHNSECSRELKLGDKLCEELISEFRHIDTDSPVNSTKLRAFFENYLDELRQLKLNNSVLFPWATYDESMEKNCLNVVQHYRLEECRSYLIGYMEVVTRVPRELFSSQGKLTYESAGWAVQRHPFGSVIAAFRIVLSSLAKEIYMEKMSPSTVKSIVDNFVKFSQQVWCICWEKCEKGCSSLSEILVESIQHCLFLHCQFLPHILFGYDSKVLSLVSQAGNLDINPFELVELRQPLKLDDLYRVCGVPIKYQIFPTSKSSTIGDDTSMISSEELCWLSISENPFLGVSKDISVFPLAKTPIEVADIAVSILKSISVVSSSIFEKSGANGAAIPSELAADDLIPLLTLSFALYFRTPIISPATHYMRYQNPVNFLSMLKFADAYLPNHLAVREEGYAVTVCLSALQTLPV